MNVNKTNDVCTEVMVYTMHVTMQFCGHYIQLNYCNSFQNVNVARRIGIMPAKQWITYMPYGNLYQTFMYIMF